MGNREEMIVEFLLRENIRNIIKDIKAKAEAQEKQEKLAESMVREIVRSMIISERVATPKSNIHDSTSLNALESLFPDILSDIKNGYTMIRGGADSREQRKSFEDHILNAFKSTLETIQYGDDVPDGEPDVELAEEVSLKVGETDKLVGDNEEEVEVEDKEETELKKFSKGLDKDYKDNTGRNFAYKTYQRIEQKIINASKPFDNNEEQEEFKNAGLTNLKLYFDKFENEIAEDAPEITTSDYEAAKEQGIAQGSEGEEEEEVTSIETEEDTEEEV